MENLSVSGDVVVYLLGLAVTWGGIVWRISALEKKVDKHNQIIERTFRLEGQMAAVEKDIDEIRGVVR